jgi:hypothetical protein
MKRLSAFYGSLIAAAARVPADADAETLAELGRRLRADAAGAGDRAIKAGFPAPLRQQADFLVEHWIAAATTRPDAPAANYGALLDQLQALGTAPYRETDDDLRELALLLLEFGLLDKAAKQGGRDSELDLLKIALRDGLGRRLAVVDKALGWTITPDAYQSLAVLARRAPSRGRLNREKSWLSVGAIVGSAAIAGALVFWVLGGRVNAPTIQSQPPQAPTGQVVPPTTAPDNQAAAPPPPAIAPTPSAPQPQSPGTAATTAQAPAPGAPAALPPVQAGATPPQAPSLAPSEPAQQSAQATVPAPQATAPAGETPSPPVQAAALSPGAVTELLRRYDCAELNWSTDSSGLRLSGHVASADDKKSLLDAVAKLPGVAAVKDDVRLLGPPLCSAIATLEPARKNDVMRGLALDVRVDGETSLVRGKPLSMTITAPSFDAYIYVDLFRPDGKVQHLIPNALDTLRRLPARSLYSVGKPPGTFTTWTIGEPTGDQVIAVVAAREPLFEAARPETEDAKAYLTDLGTRLNASLSKSPGGVAAAARSIVTKASG